MTTFTCAFCVEDENGDETVLFTTQINAEQPPEFVHVQNPPQGGPHFWAYLTADMKKQTLYYSEEPTGVSVKL